MSGVRGTPWPTVPRPRPPLRGCRER